MNTRPIHRWPRIRARKDGAQVVCGWYTVQWRFKALRRVTSILIHSVGTVLLLFSLMPMFGDFFGIVPEGTVWYLILNTMAHLRQWPLYELQDRFPEYAGSLRSLWLHPSAPFNAVYFLTGMVLYRYSWLLSAPSARILALTLPPLVKRRVTVRIDRGRVRFLHAGWPRRYTRNPGVRVQFSSEQKNQAAPPGFGKEPSYQALMRYGHHRVVLCGSMHARDAERLALGLSYARDLSDGINPDLSQSPGPMPAMPTGW